MRFISKMTLAAAAIALAAPAALAGEVGECLEPGHSGPLALLAPLTTATAAELDDLAADPLETRDLSAAQPQRTAALERRLVSQVQENTRLAKRFRAAAQEVLKVHPSFSAPGFVPATMDYKDRAKPKRALATLLQLGLPE